MKVWLIWEFEANRCDDSETALLYSMLVNPLSYAWIWKEFTDELAETIQPYRDMAIVFTAT